VIEEAPGVVILDEAYGEFCEAPGFSLIGTSRRLVVMRTLSKAFGLAGLRLVMRCSRPTWARAHGRAWPLQGERRGRGCRIGCSDPGPEWVRARAEEARANRARFIGQLCALGFEALPSEANFVLVPHEGAQRLADAALGEAFCCVC